VFSLLSRFWVNEQNGNATEINISSIIIFFISGKIGVKLNK
jgi:hypothetical protein